MHVHPRHKVRRVAQRGHYDEASIHAILDEGWIAHVSFADGGGQPFVIPMLYVREGDVLYLHGSIASRLLKSLGEGVDTCLCVTLVDGMVLARSHFHHSMNYRSVVVFGKAVAVADASEKAAIFVRFVDALLPGRAAEARPADDNEINATALLRVRIEEASAKIRSGGPKDDPADRALPIWSGVIPLALSSGEPIAADDATPGLALPDSVRKFSARWSRQLGGS